MPYRLGLCVLRSTYRQDYETLFPVVILSKHHHHHIYSYECVLIIEIMYKYIQIYEYRDVFLDAQIGT
jgi:hypothetical protein